MSKSSVTVGSVLVIGNGEARVIAQPKMVWKKVRAAKIPTVRPEWLETNNDRTSEAGALISFTSVL